MGSAPVEQEREGMLGKVPFDTLAGPFSPLAIYRHQLFSHITIDITHELSVFC